METEDDHDLFPFRNFYMSEVMGEQPFYGADRKRDRLWYLWPGFMAFRFSEVVKRKLNFLPVFVGNVYLDAGGSNYFRLFQNYKYEDILFADTRTARIKVSRLSKSDDVYHGDCVQVIDQTWIHLINGSNCAKIRGKDKMVNGIIDRFDEFVFYLRKIKMIENDSQ